VTTTALFRRDLGTAIEDDVSPPREIRSTDVSRLRAQAGTIVAIVVAAISIVLYTERSNSELRSDIRVILNRLDSQKENIDLRLQIMRLEFEKGELRKALLAELKDTP
jgi:hypothetical protein